MRDFIYSSVFHILAMMFMVDLGKRDEKQLKQLADAITVLGCSMELKIQFLETYF
ncbi:hypothetical protein Hanom_Chr15g01369131 [Helianthus anomalus]